MISALPDDFSELFAITSRATRARADRLLRGFGLHAGQQYVLRCLWSQDGSTVGELATQVRVELPTLTRTVGRMEQGGVVERRSDERDGRLVRVWLTERGRRLRQELPDALGALESEFLAGFSEAERAEFVRLLQKLHRTATANS